MTAVFATQIELDDQGVAWIGGTKVKVIENQTHLDAQIRHRLEEAGKLAAQVSDADFRRKLSDLKRSL